MIIFPMLPRTSEHCSSRQNWLNHTPGLTKHLTHPRLAYTVPNGSFAGQRSPKLSYPPFPTSPTHPWKTWWLSTSPWLVRSCQVIPTLPDSGHHIWGDGGQGGGGWWKRESSILYGDLFPLLPLLRPLNFKHTDLWLCLSDRWHKAPREWWYEPKMFPNIYYFVLLHILALMASHYFSTHWENVDTRMQHNAFHNVVKTCVYDWPERGHCMCLWDLGKRKKSSTMCEQGVSLMRPSVVGSRITHTQWSGKHFVSPLHSKLIKLRQL